MSSTVWLVWIRSFLLVLLAVVVVGGRAAAQEVTGTVQGTVVASEGGPLPGVHITVAGPHLQGSRETATDRRGFFQFLALPPGAYALHVSRVGLQPVDVREVVVELGRTTALRPLALVPQPITLEPGPPQVGS